MEDKKLISTETFLPVEGTINPKQQISVSERLELAKKLQSLGSTGLDKRIYKNGRK